MVLGEISLMMDCTLLPIDKVYDAITTPAKRRKIVFVKRHTSDPKALQNARSLGKDLFAEMGPDGEDALFAFLQAKLKGWQVLPLTATSRWPIPATTPARRNQRGPSLINKLLADNDSFKFIERFNTLKKDLLDFADQFHDLEHFYDHQRPTWEKLRKANEHSNSTGWNWRRDAQAGPALKRMQEILSARSPYGLIKDAEP